MNPIGLYENIKFAYIHLTWGLSDRICSFHELLQRINPHTHGPAPSFSPLTLHSICVGGVENMGTSCTLSAILHEWAAFPEYFDIFLTSPLQQKVAESDEHFLCRKDFQNQLQCFVTTLRSGGLVVRKDICQLAKLLRALGCLTEMVTPLQQVFQGWLPGIYNPRLTNPYELYENILTQFSEVPVITNQIAIMSRISSVSQRQLLEQSPIFQNSDDPILLNIAEDYTTSMIPLDSIQVKNRVFTLKMVHACEETPSGKHVVVYRREGNQWIYCNDAKVCLVDELPSTNIYAVVYASHT